MFWLIYMNDDEVEMSPDQIRERLEKKYQDANIEVVDLTGTQDHYQVSIISKSFDGMSRIERHKDVMSVFDDELKSGEVHALTIKAKTEESL